jgi:hypothetical protein
MSKKKLKGLFDSNDFHRKFEEFNSEAMYERQGRSLLRLRESFPGYNKLRDVAKKREAQTV